MAVINGATGPKSSISAPTSATIPENMAGKVKVQTRQYFSNLFGKYALHT